MYITLVLTSKMCFEGGLCTYQWQNREVQRGLVGRELSRAGARVPKRTISSRIIQFENSKMKFEHIVYLNHQHAVSSSHNIYLCDGQMSYFVFVLVTVKCPILYLFRTVILVSQYCDCLWWLFFTITTMIIYGCH